MWGGLQALVLRSDTKATCSQFWNTIYIMDTREVVGQMMMKEKAHAKAKAVLYRGRNRMQQVS